MNLMPNRKLVNPPKVGMEQNSKLAETDALATERM